MINIFLFQSTHVIFPYNNIDASTFPSIWSKQTIVHRYIQHFIDLIGSYHKVHVCGKKVEYRVRMIGLRGVKIINHNQNVSASCRVIIARYRAHN